MTVTDHRLIVEYRCDRAFNQGCDACLLGAPRTANPYADDQELANSWLKGWDHTYNYWGTGVNGRWPYLQLGAHKSRLKVLSLAREE